MSKVIPVFIDKIKSGDYYDGKQILAIEPPTHNCPSWVIWLKGERVPRHFGKDSQLLIERIK